ncbi:MAG: TetR/AcrR family transcriptional regulator [Bacteroidota bacterium]
MKHKNQERLDAREQQIIAAAEAVLLEVGIDHFTVNQVAEKAGIAKGTIYNYYENKNSILARLGAKALDLLHQTFQKAADQEDSYLGKIKTICSAHYQYSKTYPQYSNLIFYVEKLEFDRFTQNYVRRSHAITNYIIYLIQKGQQTGEIAADIKPKTLTHVLWVVSVGMTEFLEVRKNLLKEYDNLDIDIMINLFNRILDNGLKK